MVTTARVGNLSQYVISAYLSRVMAPSERDFRAPLASAGWLAAQADPDKLHAALLAITLFETTHEPEHLTRWALTKREGELLFRAMRGETNAEIGRTLCISERTVAKHLEHAYAKLGVHGRREAARLISDALR